MAGLGCKVTARPPESPEEGRPQFYLCLFTPGILDQNTYGW
jgi:hypothetical protein